jgi:hypothetical protein
MQKSTKLSVALWTVQGLLALLFAFAGIMKLVTPIEVMVEQSGMPGWFLQFIGTCEMLGAIGLIVPGIIRVRPYLTSVAATGLVIIMIGATTLTAAGGQLLPALFPLVVGLLATFVAYNRHQPSARSVAAPGLALQPARLP